MTLTANTNYASLDHLLTTLLNYKINLHETSKVEAEASSFCIS